MNKMKYDIMMKRYHFKQFEFGFVKFIKLFIMIY